MSKCHSNAFFFDHLQNIVTFRLSQIWDVCFQHFDIFRKRILISRQEAGTWILGMMHTSQLWDGLHAHFITKFCLSDSSQHQYPIKSILSYFSLELLSIQGQKMLQAHCWRTSEAAPCAGLLCMAAAPWGIRSTACSRNSPRQIRDPTVSTLMFPLFLTVAVWCPRKW